MRSSFDGRSSNNYNLHNSNTNSTNISDYKSRINSSTSSTYKPTTSYKNE